MQTFCSCLIFCLCLRETTGICLHEPHSGNCYKCFKLSPGTILKLLPIGLLLGSVEIDYPLNSTCSAVDTELCVCVRVYVCLCVLVAEEVYTILSSCNMTNCFFHPSCVGGEMENMKSNSIYDRIIVH